MLEEIQQVLRWVMLLEKQTQQQRLTAGGLLILVWTDTGDSLHSINCAVAAAGPWYSGFQRKVLQPVLADLKESMSACTWSSPQADPEELCAFTDMHGSLRLLLSFQMKDARLFGPGWCAQMEAFLHSFSLANARIKIHFKFKVSQQSFQQDFRAKIKRRLACPNRPALLLDVTCQTQPPTCVKKGCWCHGGHPELGGTVPLSVQVLVCGPSNVPFTGSFTLLQNLPAHLDCEDLGLLGLHCSSVKVNRGDTLNTVERENSEAPGQEWSLPTMQQSLLLYLFLQHSDPFSHRLSDRMATEVLIEHHLEDILSNNRQAVTTALQTELRNSLKSQHHRKKDQEKLRSAAEVILSSTISIVSCSSNMAFRKACLNSMKVHDTHRLSASLSESLKRVTSWKFIPKCRCYSAQMEEHPCADECTRTEL
ncbi:top6bl [Pungitius sinensis]